MPLNLLQGMDHSPFTHLLPPPATVSPTLDEGTCDIVLPPPAESLYTLPRKKPILNSSGELEQFSSTGGAKGKQHITSSIHHQNGDNARGRTVRFESGPTPPNTSELPQSLQKCNPSSIGILSLPKAAKGDKAHSESSV